MTKSRSGWAAKAINNSRQARGARRKEIARLKRERVAGSEHTPAELVALHAGLKADYLAREAQRRATA